MKHLVALTAIGRDRPGIVAAVSRILYDGGCNIEDSSMTILCGEFAMILVISVPGNRRVKDLEADFKAMARRMKLFVALREIESPAIIRSRRRIHSYIISLLGSDRPGIVHCVSRLLASRCLNITDLNTRLLGTKAKPVYAMVIEVEAPPRLSLRRLGSDLAALAKKLYVDITIKPLEAFEL